MTCPFDSEQPPDVIFRIGRRSPWDWPDWANVGDDRTFGNRWDDPEGLYRVLYASSVRLGCYLETLARLRPDPAVIAGLQAIEGPEPMDPVGVVPRSWLPERSIGAASVSGEFATVGHARSLAWLRTRFAAEVVEAGLADLDAAAVRLSVPRRLTQRMSRAIYECSHESVRQYSGIAYLSRFGDEIPNWAVFEPNKIDVRDAWPIDSEDPDFIAAMEILGLRLEEE
jgi:hypothetical protein